MLPTPSNEGGQLSPGPPPRPPKWQERLGSRLLSALAPKVPRGISIQPPEHLAPFEPFKISRSDSPGYLAATWFPADSEARGAVLLTHPLVKVGQAYFHRQGRLEALRAKGFHALTVDLGGLGSSTPFTGFIDREVTDSFNALEERAAGLPLYFWGVSIGGYWSHLALGRTSGVQAAMFEDVTSHLIQWSWRMTPWARPAFLVFRYGLSKTYRYLDIRSHIPYFKSERLAYVGGGCDRGVPAEETRDLARRGGGECLVIQKSGHLSSIKRANAEVVGLALKTFGMVA